MDLVVFSVFGKDITVGILLIPIISGVIAMATNWVAVKMMFLPLYWWGPRLPFKLGFGRYKVPLLGWQGVIPSKAAKMGSIAVDTGLAKLGTIFEFYTELNPEVMAAHIVEVARDDIHEQVDAVLRRNHPELWATAPPQIKRMVHARVDSQLPTIVASVMDEIGSNIERLIDLKLMVIRYLENDPALLNKIFLDVGAKEFKIIVWSGLWIGTPMGLIPMLLWIVYPVWWTVPVCAAIMAYVTNWIAIKILFAPLEPTTYFGIPMHGLFLRRQDEVSEAYSNIIAYDIVTLTNVANQMLNGPDGDRTKRLIADIISPAVDEAVGVARPMLTAATRGRFNQFSDDLALETVSGALGTLTDEKFSKERAAGMQLLLAERMRALSFKDMEMMLRSAFQQDEWLLLMVGGVLGFIAGIAQLVLTL